MTISEHQKDYKEGAWKNYTLGELGMWYDLLTKRAGHRTNQEKKEKDLYDAGNYLWMLKEKLKEY